jgi:hypothetical protein
MLFKTTINFNKTITIKIIAIVIIILRAVVEANTEILFNHKIYFKINLEVLKIVINTIKFSEIPEALLKPIKQLMILFNKEFSSFKIHDLKALNL